MKTNIFSTMVLCLSLGATFNACNCEDEISLETQWNNIKTKSGCEGYVFTSGNKPLPNALVTIVVNGKEYTYTTNEKGLFIISDLESGTYDVTISYPEDPTYVTSTSTIVLEDNTVSNVNAILYPINTIAETAPSPEGTLYSIALPDVVSTNTSTSQNVCFNIPTGALETGDSLLLATKYDIQKSITRAYSPSGNDIVIICDSKSLLGKKKLNNKFLIYAYGLCEPSVVYHNGAEVKVNYNENENGRYYFFTTTDLGTTEFHFPIKISSQKVETNTITFSPSVFEGEEKHISTTYRHKSGADITMSNTYLDQYVALIQGCTKSQTVGSNFEQDVYIPKGEMVFVSGLQTVTSFSYACGITSDSIVQYGKIYTKVSDRMHNGGSSK